MAHRVHCLRGTAALVAGTATDSEGSVLPGAGVTIQGNRLGATSCPFVDITAIMAIFSERFITSRVNAGIRPKSIRTHLLDSTETLRSCPCKAWHGQAQARGTSRQ